MKRAGVRNGLPLTANASGMTLYPLLHVAPCHTQHALGSWVRSNWPWLGVCGRS